MELKNLVVYGFLIFTVVVLVAALACACLLIARPGLFTGAGIPNHRTCGESPTELYTMLAILYLQCMDRANYI